MKKGFTLIEILVVIAVFAGIGVITSQSVLTTLRGARKADSDSLVRQNVDYSLSVIERQLRSAQSITPCPLPAPTRIDFIDDAGNPAYFRLNSNRLDLNADHLTSSDVSVTSVVFTCTSSTGSSADVVNVVITASDANETGAEGSAVTSSINITLRNSS